MRTDPGRRSFRRMEIIGYVIVCICAPLLHFTYEWAGENVVAGLFSAVNESVWEHTKLIYFPMLVYAVIEYILLKPDMRRFLAAKSIALAFSSLVTIVFFYAYTGALGAELLLLDVLCTFVWAALGFLISYRLYYSRFRLQRYLPLFLILFLAQLAAQLLFTPYPPGFPLFADHSGG